MKLWLLWRWRGNVCRTSLRYVRGYLFGEKEFKIGDVRLRISHREREARTTYGAADTEVGGADIVAHLGCVIRREKIDLWVHVLSNDHYRLD